MKDKAEEMLEKEKANKKHLELQFQKEKEARVQYAGRNKQGENT